MPKYKITWGPDGPGNPNGEDIIECEDLKEAQDDAWERAIDTIWSSAELVEDIKDDDA